MGGGGGGGGCAAREGAGPAAVESDPCEHRTQAPHTGTRDRHQRHAHTQADTHRQTHRQTPQTGTTHRHSLMSDRLRWSVRINTVW